MAKDVAGATRSRRTSGYRASEARASIRPKEIEAFKSLILLRGDTLSLPERQQVVNPVRSFSRDAIKTWEEVMQRAQEANVRFKLGI